MLRLDPHERLSAADSLNRASISGLFHGAFSKTENVTPRLQPCRDAGEVDQEDQSTIILSRLWEDNSGSSPSGAQPGQTKDKSLSRANIEISPRDSHVGTPTKYRKTLKQARTLSLPGLPSDVSKNTTYPAQPEKRPKKSAPQPTKFTPGPETASSAPPQLCP